MLITIFCWFPGPQAPHLSAQNSFSNPAPTLLPRLVLQGILDRMELEGNDCDRTTLGPFSM